MPNLKSSIKDMAKSAKNRIRNLDVQTRLKTLSRNVEKAADAEAAKVSLHTATRAWDKAVAQGIAHPNTAARKKSRMSRAVAKRFAKTK